MKLRKWVKMHSDVWFDPRLRVAPCDVRVALADLTHLAQPDGRLVEPVETLAAICGVTVARMGEILAVLAGFGFVLTGDAGLQVASILADNTYSQSRKPGGKARQRAKDAQHRAQHDAQHSSASTSSSDSDSDSDSDSERARGKKATKAVEAAPATDLPAIPAALNRPEVVNAMHEWVAYRRERHLAPWKPCTWTKNLKEWSQWGPSATAEQINASIRNSWQGVFAPRGPTPIPRNEAPRAPVQNLDALFAKRDAERRTATAGAS